MSEGGFATVHLSFPYHLDGFPSAFGMALKIIPNKCPGIGVLSRGLTKSQNSRPVHRHYCTR